MDYEQCIAKFQSIKPHMTESEVVELMGEPHKKTIGQWGYDFNLMTRIPEANTETQIYRSGIIDFTSDNMVQRRQFSFVDIHKPF